MEAKWSPYAHKLSMKSLLSSLQAPQKILSILTALAEACRKPAGIAIKLLNSETASIFLVLFVDSSLI